MKELLKLYDIHKDEICQYKIIIVANVRKHTGDFKSYILNKANSIEFFSDEEFDSICCAIATLKLFTKIYYNELDFIEDVLEEEYDLNKIIIINFARNGVIEGKKSLIPSFCDLLNIKYTTANAFVQSLCRDKFVWSCVLQSANLPALKSIFINNKEIIGIEKFDKKEDYILKPKSESSSLNVSRKLKADKIIDFAVHNEKNFIAQKYLSGKEIEVPFFELNGKYYIQEPTQINYSGDMLYENLSEENNYFYSNCNLSKTIITEIKENVLKTAKILGIKKYGRIDFKFDDNGNAYIIDIATLPYLTPNSSFAFSASQHNLQYNSIFKALITIALLTD